MHLNWDFTVEKKVCHTLLLLFSVSGFLNSGIIFLTFRTYSCTVAVMKISMLTCT
jgi:hypothetical protein